MAGKKRHGHGRPMSRTYQSWVAMRQRCNNPNILDYANYGARGITVCARWSVFENFLADMGERPGGMSLDRYPDRAGNYEPGNCRWATRHQQSVNSAANKLSETDVAELRRLFSLGWTHRELANFFDVGNSTAYYICTHQKWRQP